VHDTEQALTFESTNAVRVEIGVNNSLPSELSQAVREFLTVEI